METDHQSVATPLKFINVSLFAVINASSFAVVVGVSVRIFAMLRLRCRVVVIGWGLLGRDFIGF